MAETPLTRITLEVPGTAEHLGDLHLAVERFWSEVDRALNRPPEEEWRLVFTTALGEAAANVVRHAYRDGALSGRLRVELLAYEDRIEARFTDWGVEFEGSLTPSPPAPEEVVEELPEGGYGLSLIRAAVDELRYERTSSDGSGPENRWQLLKRLPATVTPPD